MSNKPINKCAKFLKDWMKNNAQGILLVVVIVEVLRKIKFYFFLKYVNITSETSKYILKLLHSFLYFMRTTDKHFRLCNQNSIKIKTSFLAKLFEKSWNREKNTYEWIYLCIYFTVLQLHKNQIKKSCKISDFHNFLPCNWSWETIIYGNNFFFTK